jgi:hypothetical protein
MLKLFILGNRHSAAMAGRSRCALRTQGASIALLRIKLDHSPEGKGHGLPGWASEASAAHVHVEGGLGK